MAGIDEMTDGGPAGAAGGPAGAAMGLAGGAGGHLIGGVSGGILKGMSSAGAVAVGGALPLAGDNAVLGGGLPGAALGGRLLGWPGCNAAQWGCCRSQLAIGGWLAEAGPRDRPRMSGRCPHLPPGPSG